ncbi:TonB family protein [Dyella sp. LX-66]|uniref:TonB family protein n=1 Tax=unclassified Dyella TaxID=2634549 RepID=UPI001BDFAB85|nr:MULTISPECIES: TonB family protein [unclassified Dyella]MBT2115598.1 TonB family protein [Dyella sp. LX-1]MBT2139413.1 TonB family protein [Dyella sp. LX-66]
MHRSGPALRAVGLWLALCAPVLATAQNGLPPTHAVAQDLTYNAQFPPRFPPGAAQAGHFGKVLLMVLVRADGSTGEVKVERSSGFADLDASAVNVAKHWRFMPAARDGVPVAGWARVPVDFHADAPAAAGSSAQAGGGDQADRLEADRLLLAAVAGDDEAKQRLDHTDAAKLPALEDGKLFVLSKQQPDQRAALIERASHGDTLAQYLVGAIYETGYGVDKDPTAAVDWFRKSADAGNPVGQYKLGQLYESGWHVSKDPKQAFELHMKAARQNMAAAQHAVGRFYEHGLVVAQDYQEALSWYRKSAAAGNPNAQTSLGYLYQQGLGVPADEKTAFDWFQQAARQGQPVASFNLGLMYVKGQSVLPNRRAAIPLFEKAAEAGLAPAQYSLGLIYEQDVEIPADYAKALQWFSICLAGGDQQCSDHLETAHQHATPAQVAEGESAARDWLAHHPARAVR